MLESLMTSDSDRRPMISGKVCAVAGGLALLVMSGLITAFPLASAQSTVVVSMPSGAGSGASAAPGYAPDNIIVVIGVNNTVEWTNNDTVAGKGTSHTVTPKTQPAAGNWPSTGSGNMLVNTTYSFTFTVPGNYTYYCTYHSWMTGTVIVEAASTSTATHTTPEFPAAYLALILFAVIAAVILVAPRLSDASFFEGRRPRAVVAPPALSGSRR
jgi:plastocyanin